MKSTYDETITRRLFFSMAPVQILLVMCGGINTIIDSAFASNLIGPDAMAVTGLYNPLSLIFTTIHSLIFCGAQILCGKCLGENTLKRAKGIFTLDMLVIGIVGLISTFMFMFAPGFTASICTRSSNPLHAGLIEYLKGLSVGVVPYLFGLQLTSFLQLEKKEKVGYISIAAMFVFNCIGDYVFLAVLDLDLFGLGLATSLSNWVSFIVPACYFIFSKKAVFKISFKDMVFSDIKDICIKGWPAAGTFLMIAIRGFALNALVLKYTGTDGMAAFSAIGSFGTVYWAVPAGMSSALVTLASVYTGEKDRDALQVLVGIFFKRALPLVIGVSLLLSALCYPLTNIFFHDPTMTVYQMTLMGFILFPLSTPTSLVIVGMRDIWRCMEFHKGVNVVVVGDGIAMVLIFSYLFAPIWGMLGIWLAQIAGGIALVLIMYIMAWVHGRKVPLSMRDICCFSDSFGVDDDHRLAISIRSMEDVINVSERVIEFCEAHGIDKIKSFRAGLCVEELAGNIAKHGFTNKKNSIVDVCLLIIDGELSIRFKDNCALFNPAEFEAIFVPDDPCKNGGIRLVRKTCKEMEYHTLLGLNVMSIVM